MKRHPHPSGKDERKTAKQKARRRWWARNKRAIEELAERQAVIDGKPLGRGAAKV